LVFTYKSKTLSKTDLFKKLKNLFILYRPKTNNMKKIVPLFLLLLPVLAIAQKNAVKVNLSSLVLRNYNIQYERKIVSKLTVNIGFRTMPKGKLPWQDQLVKYAGLDNQNLELGRFQIGNTAFTVEPRIYLSKKAMKGFYIGPYARWASFDLALPFQVKYNNISGAHSDPVDFTGKVTSFSGGLKIGTQFNIAKHIVLDICWVGGHYGSSKGDLNFAGDLSDPNKRQAVKDAINSFDPSPFKITSTVGTTGAQIQSDGPWAGFSGLSLGLGIRF
jgi:hypothetical protein